MPASSGTQCSEQERHVSYHVTGARRGQLGQSQKGIFIADGGSHSGPTGVVCLHGHWFKVRQESWPYSTCFLLCTQPCQGTVSKYASRCLSGGSESGMEYKCENR